MSTLHLRLADRLPPGRLRAPGLELMLGGTASVLAVDWRQDAFASISVGSAAPSVAGAALFAACGSMPGRWACLASPVHLLAGLTDVRMPADGILELQTTEAGGLADDFTLVFADAGARLVAGPGSQLFCIFDRVLDVVTHDPAAAIDRDMFGLQPAGVDAPRLKRLMSEVELWLHEHAVNRERTARGAAVITGLWLWGGGPTLQTLPEVRGWTSGADPLFAAFGSEAALPPPQPDGRRAAGVLVCDVPPGVPQWADFELRWLDPVAAALRRHEFERVTLSLGERMVSVTRVPRWRFWRRARPWWESLAEPVAESLGGS